MGSEPDLASAIAEVQVALERLRLAAERSSSSSQGWEFVDSPPEASASRAAEGLPNSRVASPQTPKVAPRRPTPATPTRAETADLCGVSPVLP